MNDLNLLYLANVCAALILSPMLLGVIARVKAFFAGRHGIPVCQLYFDIFKLLKHNSVYSTSTCKLFKITPVVTLAATLCALLLLPCGEESSHFAFPGDMLFFVYIFALARGFTVLAAMDTASSFEGMGSARELHFAIFSECALMAMLGVLCVYSGGELSLSGIFLSLGERETSGGIAPMALVIAAAGFFMVMLAENCRVPADDPETHLELTMIHEAMILDYSGPDLALIHYASALKLWVFGQLLVMMLFPHYPWWIVVPGVFASAVAVGVVESITARYRLLKVPHYLMGAFALELAALALHIRECL